MQNDFYLKSEMATESKDTETKILEKHVLLSKSSQDSDKKDK